MDKKRCFWASDLDNKLMVDYHDNEYGRMKEDNDSLFELFCMELLQTGLSWNIVLQKRAALNQAFHNFKIDQVANMEFDESMLKNDKIIRNAAKLKAIINNAKVIKDNNIDLKSYVINSFNTHNVDFVQESKQYKKGGFKFVGPSTIESLNAALGLFNAHEKECFLHDILEREGK